MPDEVTLKVPTNKEEIIEFLRDAYQSMEMYQVNLASKVESSIKELEQMREAQAQILTRMTKLSSWLSYLGSAPRKPEPVKVANKTPSA